MIEAQGIGAEKREKIQIGLSAFGVDKLGPLAPLEIDHNAESMAGQVAANQPVDLIRRDA
jgi:hypothetical protein